MYQAMHDSCSAQVTGPPYELGERFVRGVLLHTGPLAYDLDDRILAVPISALWS